MKIIIAILGSGVLSALVTAILKNRQDDRNNSLNYITEERKNWREKLRTIAKQIQSCEYGDKKINKYLLQLELNINAYGRYDEYNYLEDGHIWKIIDELKKADNEQVFEKSKEVLFSYLTSLLKYDWERSKEEVNGKNKTKKYLLIYVITGFVFSGYYFWILGLRDVWLFVALINIYIGTAIIEIYLFRDSLWLGRKIRKEDEIQQIHKQEKKFAMNYRLMTFVMIISVIFSLGGVFLCEKEAISNIKYLENDGKQQLCTGINKYFVPSVEEEVEDTYGMELQFFQDETKDMKSISELEQINQNELEQMFFDELDTISIVIGIWMAGVQILIILQETDKKSKMTTYYAHINQLHIKAYRNYETDMKRAVVLMEQSLELKQEKKVLLAAAYKILMDVEIQNMLLLKELGVNISDQGEARDYLKLQKQKGILKKCKKVIQKYGKKISLRKRKKLENVIQEVKRCFGMQED